jgi:hypothetical protein
MLTKTIQVTRNAVDRDEARITFSLADDASPHPGCLVASVMLSSDGEEQTVYMQHATRDANGNVTGRVPAPGVTVAQLAAARTALRAAFDVAAAAAGYA